MDLRIVNMAANGHFLVDLINLKELAYFMPNTELCDKRFYRLVIRNKNPRYTALLYQSGKCVITGTTNEKDAKKSYSHLQKELFKNGVWATKKIPLVISNITTSGTLDIKIDFSKLKSSSELCYEPELFPSIIFSNKKDRFKASYFHKSQKYIMTGFKSTTQFESFYKQFIEKLNTIKE